MATIREIADRASVSNATVSRVLNYDETLSISIEKKKMIFEIAQEINYQTPRQRKAIINKKIKIVLYNWYTEEEELQDTYYMSIRLGIERKCREENIDLVKIFRNNQIPKGDYYGAIALGKFSEIEVNKIKEMFENIVFVDEDQNEIYDSVYVDFKLAMDKVFNFLFEDRKIKSIGYIGGLEFVGEEKKNSIGENRLKYYKEYLNQLGILNEDFIYIGKFNTKSGYELMKKAIDKDLPESFFIASDTMAIGALKALYEAGLRVPDDIKIVGFNDIPTSEFTIPPLTTIRVYTEFMGETAIDLILERAKGREISKKIIIPTELIIRGSV